MSEERREEAESEFDADQLAALARPSVAPAAESDDDDDDDDDDDGPLDLRALATSMAPPAPDDDDEEEDDDDLGAAATVAAASAPVSEPVAAKRSSPAKASGTAAKSAAAASSRSTSAVQATALESSSGTGKMLLGLVIGVAVAAGAYAAWGRTGTVEPVAVADDGDRFGSSESGGIVAPTGDEHRDDPAGVPFVETTVVEPVVDETEELEQATTNEGTEGFEASSQRARRDPARRGGGNRVAEQDTSVDTVAMEPDMEAAVVAAEPDMATPVAEMTTTAASEMASSMDDMDDLLNRALGGTPAAGGTQTVMTAEPAPMEDTSDLPDVPSRAAVTRALGGLMPRMRRCAGDQVGTATARIRVGNDGQVQAANIGGSPFGGTPQGSCMEDVVRTAHFPRFQRTNFDVTYPFSIRPLN